jgi:hypothetical protein
MPQLPQQAREILTSSLLQYLLAGLVLLVAALILWKILSRRKKPALREPAELRVDVSQLPSAGPPAEPPFLEYYHVPVRLAVLVLAPAGRDRVLPPPEDLAELVEAIVPGLSGVVAAHKPLVCRWGPQLSTQGFTHRFFADVKLPGDGGKGTPWSSAAGVFRFRGKITLAGLVIRAGSAVHFGQRRIEEEAKWLDVLRVKGSTGDY